jgi:hypothetical protein
MFKFGGRLGLCTSSVPHPTVMYFLLHLRTMYHLSLGVWDKHFVCLFCLFIFLSIVFVFALYIKFFFLFVAMLLIGHNLYCNYGLYVIGVFNIV